MTAEAEPLVFNPFDPAFRVDPYPTLSRLREEDPYHVGFFGTLVLGRYADVIGVLRDPRASSDARNSTQYQELVAAGTPPAGQVRQMEGMQPFLFLDPPDHTRLRGLVGKAFTPKVVEALRPRVQELVDGLLDVVVAKGTMEVIEDLAYPLPVIVICELLGVPASDHETFKGWSKELARSLDPDFSTTEEELQRRADAGLEFAEYFRGLMAERRRNPGDDLLSGLVQVEDQGDVLTEDELLSTLILLLVAGHETTVNLIANGVLALLRHPDQLARLRADPSLDRTAADEVLRFDPPVQFTARVALDDIPVGDAVIAKGQQAILLLGAANRDPRQFSDPDSFDVGRVDNKHLALSFGAHYCLGAPLARLEGQIALGEIARRLPDPELAVEQPIYKENVVLRGVAALPVRFSR